MPHGVGIVRRLNLHILNLDTLLKKHMMLVWLIGNIIIINFYIFSTTNRGLCGRFSVRGYPTLKLVHPDGNTYDYNYARNIEAM